MYKKLSAPILVHWEVTYDCNKRCIHCYNYWRKEDTKIITKASFSKEHANKIVNDIIYNKVFQVVITGGEPLLVFNELYPYLKKLVDNGIEVTFNSNLSYYNENIINKLKELHINNFLVSIPASNAELDYQITNNKAAFDNTINGVKTFIKNGFKVTANMVITKLNYNDIDNNAKMVSELGIKNFSVTRAIRPSNATGFDQYNLSIKEFMNLPSILKEIKNKYKLNVFSIEAYPLCFNSDSELINETGFNRLCMAGKTFCVIDPKGIVRPCILINENYDKSLKDAWDSFDHYRNDDYLPGECLDCKYAQTCGGGCKAERLHTCGEIKKIDPYANIENKKPLPKEVNTIMQPENFNLDTKFIVNDKLKFRDEDFGGLLYLANDNYAPVEKEVFLLIKNNPVFICQEAISLLNYSLEEVSLLLSFFIKKKYISLKY